MTSEVVLRVLGPGDVSVARRAVAGLLAGADPQLADDVTLSLSELLTNAIVHGRPPVGLVARLEDETLRIEVGDGSPDRGSPQESTGLASSGRGLNIVDAVAHRWGMESRGAGKAVWMEFSLAPTTAVPEHVVQLLDVPVAAYLRGQEQLESTLHELQVLSSSDPTSFGAVEAATVIPLRRAMETFRASRRQGRTEALAAASAGLDRVDFAWRLPRDAAEAARVWASGVAELARLARDGVLLTPPPDAEVARLRRWLAAEIAGQLRQGREPEPFP